MEFLFRQVGPADGVWKGVPDEGTIADVFAEELVQLARVCPRIFFGAPAQDYIHITGLRDALIGIAFKALGAV